MTTATQKIPSGYKQTEIGVIPSDWDVKKLGELADYKNGKSFESRITDNGDYFLITLNSLDIKGKLKSDHLKVGVNDKSLGKGDLVMILSDVAHGYFLGLTDVIHEDNKYVLNQRVGALKNIRHLTPYYLSKYINLKQKYFKTAGQGSSQQNLSKDDILNFCIAYPNSKTEQSAITIAISDTEVLIEKLERLIEKKKNIKQGAMQELLTGKRRLPEFSGKWKMKKLGEVADYKNGKSFESRIIDSGDYFLITLNSLDIKGKLKNDHLKVGVSDKSLSKDDLVMILSDVAHGNFLGLTDVIPEDDKYVLNQRVGALKNIRNISPYYLSKYINLKQKYFKTAGQGSSQQNLAKDDILNFEINFPEPDEQKAITTVLYDMDTEIEKLESQLTKYQDIKQGMMQTLLTGKIRLLTK